MSNPFDEFDDDFGPEDDFMDDDMIDDDMDMDAPASHPVASAPVLVSSIDLFNLGVNHVAYVKSATVNGVKGFSIHAADGTPMAVTSDRAMARAAVIQHNMLPVSVH